MLTYLDSSVLGRAYLADEDGHREALALLEGDARLVTGPLTPLEVTGLLVRAHRAGRRARSKARLAAALEVLDADLGQAGVVTVVRPPDPVATEERGRAIIRAHGLRALDALHLAVAMAVLPELAEPGEPTAFATRDGAQAAAARHLGLAVA